MQLDNNSRLFGQLVILYCIKTCLTGWLHLSPLVPYLTTVPLSLVHRLQLLKNRQPFLRSVVAMWLSRMMKMKCSFGNSFFVCFCKSLSLVSLLATNYSSLFIDKRTLLCSQYSQMYTIQEQQSKLKFNFESFWNLVWQVDVSRANLTRA